MPILDRGRSVLCLVDLQQKLMPAIAGADEVVANAGKLLAAAEELGVPVLSTEQNPKGLGPTAVAPILDQKAYIALTAFVVNVVVVVVLTATFRALRVPEGDDQTVVDDYVADAGEADVRELPDVVDLTEDERSPTSGAPTSRGR